jgi:hypothetical protein
MAAAVMGMEDGTYSSCSQCLFLSSFLCTQKACVSMIRLYGLGLTCSLYYLCCGSKLQRPGAEACRQHELMNEQMLLLIFTLLLF